MENEMSPRAWKVNDHKVFRVVPDAEGGVFIIQQIFVKSMDDYMENKFDAILTMGLDHDEFLALGQVVNQKLQHLIEQDNQSVIDSVNSWLEWGDTSLDEDKPIDEDDLSGEDSDE